MLNSFTVNREKAKAVASSKYITKTGAYEGVISQASVRESQSGATAVDLVFKEDSGALAFIQMWVLKKDGTRTFNHDILDALLVICGVENAPVMASKVFDRNGQPHDGYRIPALEKKRVGMLLQREQRFYIDQKDGMEKETYSMNLLTPFDLTTRKIAKEIIEGTEAKRLEDLIANTKDRPGKRAVGSVPAGYSQADMAATDTGFDSGDVPF